VLAQKTIALDGTETTGGLLARLSDEALPLLTGVLEAAFSVGALPDGVPQDDSKASYCVKLQKEDGLIDWNQSAPDIDAKIRAFTPWPGTFAFYGGERIQIHKAKAVPDAGRFDSLGAGTVAGVSGEGILVKTGGGMLALQTVQRPAKKALAWRDFLNGNKAFLNARLAADAGNNNLQREV
jgi:methionyl-tRNA formyltransferase